MDTCKIHLTRVSPKERPDMVRLIIPGSLTGRRGLQTTFQDHRTRRNLLVPGK